MKKGEQFTVIDITGLFMSDEIVQHSTIEVSRRPREWDRYANSAKDKKLHLYIIRKIVLINMVGKEFTPKMFITENII